jgi:tRNA (guanine37-N1)-methyltransferase
MFKVSVVTLFPEMFPGPLGGSLPGSGLEKGIWGLETVDIRDFASDKHRSVDDTPSGGGPGMVMRADIVAGAVDAVRGAEEEERPFLYLSPRGKPLEQARVRELATGPGVSLLCGRFEGVDERVIKARGLEEVSLGDFILCGGEVAAMALIEATVRLLPGVLGKDTSAEDESFENHLLEYPHFTRPAVWEGHEIPAVLTSGHHGKVEAWRQAEALKITKERRPDLLARYQAAGGKARQN